MLGPDAQSCLAIGWCLRVSVGSYQRRYHIIIVYSRNTVTASCRRAGLAASLAIVM